MYASRNPSKDIQPKFSIETLKLAKATAGSFSRKLYVTLEKIGLNQGVCDLSLPAYTDATKGGRPGIDPAVYFRCS